MAEPRPRHPTRYGWRAKIGVIVPPTNTVNEAEWQLMAPAGITIHATRMPLHEDTTSAAGKAALYDDVRRATGALAEAGVDAIAYGCTAGSMVLPITELGNFMADVSGIACVTTAAAIVDGLTALGISRIALATPYHDALNEHEKSFLASVGITTLAMRGLGIGGGGAHEYPQIARTPQAAIRDHVVATDCADAEAMVISCTDFPVLDMIAALEAELAKPVVTSNQATFWAALRAAGIDDRFDNYGALLRDH